MFNDGLIKIYQDFKVTIFDHYIFAFKTQDKHKRNRTCYEIKLYIKLMLNKINIMKDFTSIYIFLKVL